ncbi:EAL domain-containing protein [Truepera radiovictrix]|uniref:EAL domain-containing protein n=1 Tax=Truepera radiovictrix TaxID=332249 RepID=UPI000A0753E1|nr:EAL domain-containing protein [Truepera radiovictrix]WMT56870.1 EAL domain-containing protein [Truepera radiovictrix]
MTITTSATATADASTTRAQEEAVPDVAGTHEAGGCTFCASAPAPADEAGTLHLTHPLGHTRSKLRRALAARFELQPSALGAFAVNVPEGRLHEATETAWEALSAFERGSCRVFWDAPSEARGARKVLERTLTLDGLRARLGSSWLVAMLHEKRFYNAFQPIVAASDLETPYAYECLLRGRLEDGQTVYPDAIFSTARAADLLFQVDRAARLSAISNARACGISVPLFINFNPTAIYDPRFCLRSTTQAIREAGIAPHDVVFEVVESDHIGSVEHLQTIIRFYRDQGFRVALDDLGSGYSSLTLLAELRPDFVKFDRGLVSGVHTDPFKQKLLAKLLELAHELGVATLAEGVERDEETAWLLAHGVAYLQGYAFAPPRCRHLYRSGAARRAGGSWPVVYWLLATDC